MTNKAGLTLDVRPGEVVTIGPGIRIEVIQKSGQAARLKIVAPPQDKIERSAAVRAKPDLIVT